MALGWDVYLRRVTLADALLADESFDILSKGPVLAQWSVGLSGLDWLRELEKRHEALRVCGNGYPSSSLVSVAALRPYLADGPPGLAIAESWHEANRFDRALFEKLSPNELVYIEGWDKS